MKKGMALLMLGVFFLTSCAKKSDLPEMAFEEREFDFGDIPQGSTQTHTFVFTNDGGADLQIFDAKGSCGCTIPEFPKEKIAPGQKGQIVVRFDSRNKEGKFNKSVNLQTNTKEALVTLHIKGNILVPASKTKQ